MSSKSSNKIYLVLIFTLILIAFAVFSAKKKTAGKYTAEIESSEFTDFLDKVNDITSVKMVSSGQIFHAKKVDDNWLLPEHDNYPVKFDKVRDIVVNAANLEVLDKKTSDPKRYKELGLEDPMKKDSRAIRIVFEDASGNVLEDFIAGRSRKNGGKTFYARKNDNEQTFLVKGEDWLKLTLNPNYWLQSEVFQLSEGRFKQATFDYPNDKDITIYRKESGTYGFDIKDIASGLEKKSNAPLKDAVFSLNTLQLNGVEKADFIKFQKDKTLNVTYSTFDNLDIIVKSTTDDDNDRWIKINFVPTKDASDAIKLEAKKVNDFVKEWVYIISEQSSKRMTPKFEELTKPKDKSK